MAGIATPLIFFSSRRRHTRLQGDWSSDVCSSDLLDAADYLTKPVRRERLQQALAKAARTAVHQTAERDSGPVLLIQDRGTTVRLPLSEVLYLKAEQKYVTVRTVGRSYILDGALADLETRQIGRAHV